MTRKPVKERGAPLGAPMPSMLSTVTRGGKIVISSAGLARAREGDDEAARSLIASLAYGLKNDALSGEHIELLGEALEMISRGAPVARAFMKSPFSRGKTGRPQGSVKGDPDIRRQALDLLRAANPKTDKDVRDAIKGIAKQAGLKGPEMILADIRKQLEAEGKLPQWPEPVVPRLTYDQLREKYPDMGHDFWAWAAALPS